MTIGYRLSKNGAAFEVSNTGLPNLNEIGNGWYYFNLNTTDTNTTGALYHELTGLTLDADAQLSDDVVEMNGGYLAVNVANVSPNTIGASQLADNCLTAAKFADNAINENKISEAAKLSIFTSPTLPEAYPALGADPTPAKALLALLQLASNITITGTTLTVFGLDGTTPVMTFTLNSATTPTARTRAT